MSVVGAGGYLHEIQYKHGRKIISSTIMNLFFSAQKQWIRVKALDRDRIVDEIEQGCWDHSISIYKRTVDAYPIYDEKFDNIYQTICRKIMLNLYPDESGNIIILSKIISGELKPIELASKSEAELLPEASASIRLEWKLRQGTKIKKNYVTGKKCPKCKTTDKIDFNQAQKAAIDDGYLSTGYMCDNCGHSWG